MLNPERFGLDAAAMPWAGARQMAARAISPASIPNPIMAYMAQNRANQDALFVNNRRLVLRQRDPVLGIGAQTAPLVPPGTDRRGQ